MRACLCMQALSYFCVAEQDFLHTQLDLVKLWSQPGFLLRAPSVDGFVTGVFWYHCSLVYANTRCSVVSGHCSIVPLYCCAVHVLPAQHPQESAAVKLSLWSIKVQKSIILIIFVDWHWLAQCKVTRSDVGTDHRFVPTKPQHWLGPLSACLYVDWSHARIRQAARICNSVSDLAAVRLLIYFQNVRQTGRGAA